MKDIKGESIKHFRDHIFGSKESSIPICTTVLSPKSTTGTQTNENKPYYQYLKKGRQFIQLLHSGLTTSAPARTIRVLQKDYPSAISREQTHTILKKNRLDHFGPIAPLVWNTLHHLGSPSTTRDHQGPFGPLMTTYEHLGTLRNTQERSGTPRIAKER